MEWNVELFAEQVGIKYRFSRLGTTGRKTQTINNRGADRTICFHGMSSVIRSVIVSELKKRNRPTVEVRVDRTFDRKMIQWKKIDSPLVSNPSPVPSRTTFDHCRRVFSSCFHGRPVSRRKVGGRVVYIYQYVYIDIYLFVDIDIYEIMTNKYKL